MANAVMDKPAKIAMNGVDVPTLLGTIGAVGQQTELAKFTFRANGEWLSGTHSRTSINGFNGAGGEHQRAADFVAEADHPAVLCGGDNAPTPVEYLLSALAACITAGIGNIASVRQITLHSVETTIEGDMDMQGILGLNDEVRNGFANIRASVSVKGDAPAEQLQQVVRQSVARSAVFDVLANGVNVSVDIAA
ncbi:OsmC family protein [Roseovarius sp. CAU 1744]|uniref:OsmC family protein n=1 Tax=Roseovarius sp. CAU 1744 TaxID=3140368 RepID=UPI00325B7B8A